MSSPQPFYLGYSDPSLAEKALIMARHYQWRIDCTVLPRLQLTPKGLCLLIQGFSPLYVDFTKIKKDLAHPVVRACKPKQGMRIVDATAGWGKDAALLAHSGADVLMLERQAVMAALLTDGLERLPAHNLDLRLAHVDALAYLRDLLPEAYPDLIYIDPMHPERSKSALVKREMQALQTLLGSDLDAQSLIELARTRVRYKVVVKWPQRIAPLVPPQQQVSGKTVRFDIYRS